MSETTDAAVPIGTCSHCCEERPLRARPARSGPSRPLVCAPCAEHWLRHRAWPEVEVGGWTCADTVTGQVVRVAGRVPAAPSLDDLDARGPDWADAEIARRVSRERRKG